MRAICAALAAALVLAVPARAQQLKKLGLDEASSASPKVEVDTAVKVEGTGSLKISARWPATVFLGEVAGLDVENATLVYSARVKADLDGTAFLEMWVRTGGGQYFSKGLDDVVGPKSDWKTIRTPFRFQKGQRPDSATLNVVINGKGTIWIDDIVLSKEPLK